MKKLLESIKQNKNLIYSFAAGILTTVVISCFIHNNKMEIDVTAQNNQKNSELAFKINGEKIYISEINRKLREIEAKVNYSSLKQGDKELIAKEIYVQKIVLKNALSSGSYDKYSPALRKFAIEETKNNYLQEMGQDRVTDEDTKAKYQELVESVKDKKEYQVSHILTKTRKDANKAATNLKKESFADTAKKLSIDGRSAKNGGQLGYILEGSTVKEFNDQLKKLKKGKSSQPFKTALGWHIIKLEDTRKAKPAAYDEVKERIKKSLIPAAIKSFAGELIKDAKIESF